MRRLLPVLALAMLIIASACSDKERDAVPPGYSTPPETTQPTQPPILTNPPASTTATDMPTPSTLGGGAGTTGGGNTGWNTSGK